MNIQMKTGLNISKHFVSMLFLSITIVGCEDSLLNDGDAVVGSLAESKSEINGGEKLTSDPILKMKNAAPSNIQSMKISFNETCQGGEWVPYSSDVELVTPAINGVANLSVQFMDSEGEVSTCIINDIEHNNPNTAQICQDYPDVCMRDPMVTEPGVVTILLALGDAVNNELIVNGSSAQVIAETAIRFASPKMDPAILIVKDRLHRNESFSDTAYIRDELLEHYSVVHFMNEPVGGLDASHFAGYDLIWFNNPGYPMSSPQTRDALINFSGGVVLSGDDLTRGRTENGQIFNLDALTGLTYVDNGTRVTCDGVSYNHDNNNGYQYQVLLDGHRLPTFPGEAMFFVYGNDIDNSYLARTDLEVISWAHGGVSTCNELRPVITRYSKLAPPL